MRSTRSIQLVRAVAVAAVLPIVACASTRTVGEEVSDSAITANVKSRLAAHPDVRARKIDVDTLDAEVRLSGVVASRTERREADEIARRTRGVRAVDNDLTIGDPTAGEKLDDKVVAVRVKAALIDDDVVKARDIDVDVVGGVVTLSGEVASRQEKRRAAVVASGVRGVEKVRNLLVVAS